MSPWPSFVHESSLFPWWQLPSSQVPGRNLDQAFTTLKWFAARPNDQAATVHKPPCHRTRQAAYINCTRPNIRLWVTTSKKCRRRETSEQYSVIDGVWRPFWQAHTLPGRMMNEMMIMTMTIMTVAYSMRRAWFAARPNDQTATGGNTEV